MIVTGLVLTSLPRKNIPGCRNKNNPIISRWAIYIRANIKRECSLSRGNSNSLPRGVIDEKRVKVKKNTLLLFVCGLAP
jgi:hypothetical protein